MSNFAHLHLHTEYSLLDGACKINELMERVESLGQTHVAMTDHGVMYGAIDFYRAAKAKGIKPIIGCEVYLAPHSRFDKGYTNGEWHTHLILLCENQKGYQNLIHMVSLAFTEGFYMKPRIDMELLRKYSDGLICLSACLAGQIPRMIMNGDFQGAKDKALEFYDIFGKDRFYLEIQDHGIPVQQTVNEGIIRISQQTGIELVATNDAHYLTKQDAKIQDVLMAVQMGKTVDDPTRMKFETEEFYVKSEEEMLNLFYNHKEAVYNTMKIADMCNVEFEFGTYHLPAFDVPNGYTSEEYLRHLCNIGFAKRYPNDDGSVSSRLEYELNMIEKMGFVDYFLIVSDFISYAKQNDIAVGPGRGSAAGSVISYCLEITDLDPIEYSLYFERFLNPERVSMPDIDIDFCYVRRPEVIEYVVNKYGKDRVAQIITFGTMAARGAVRDVGRALSMPYNDVDVVAKLIPTELHITIEKALKSSRDLKNLYDSDLKVKNLIDTAQKLEGMPRNSSTHAAGVVITNEPVDTYVPLSVNGEQAVTQFTMVTLEELGLLKMDFLGLRNLTVIQDAEKLIRRHTKDFSMKNISMHDEATYNMLAQGKTTGVFQLESAGITSVVTGLKPQSIEDITAVVALYRPGPMQSIPRYIECRHDPSKVKYKHKLLESILSVTYGCMVYQEQVMEVFRVLAGYSLGKADMVRRAMSKKKLKELERERVNFIYGNEELSIVGALKNGVDEKTAESIFDEILDFANYAFNKAHAVCYAVVSYQTAYLKCNYPKEYIAALLTSVIDSSEKIAEYITEARDMGISVLPPDINESFDTFSVHGNSIRFGLVAVKNVGRNFVKKLAQEREINGKFTSFQSFCERMQDGELNKRALEGLIKVGSFDSLGYKRSQLIYIYESVLDSVSNSKKKNIEGQLDLFGMADNVVEDVQISLPNIAEYTKREMFSMEKEITGLYLSGHPMDEYKHLTTSPKLSSMRDIINDLSGENEKVTFHDGMNVKIACVITNIKIKPTKSGLSMAYLIVEDVIGSLEVVVFPKTLQQYNVNIKEDKAIIITGRIDAREDETPKIISSEILELNESNIANLKDNYNYKRISFKENEVPKANEILFLKMENRNNSEVLQILSEFSGNIPVKIRETSTGKMIEAPRKFWVCKNNVMMGKLRFILGGDCVIMK